VDGNRVKDILNEEGSMEHVEKLAAFRQFLAVMSHLRTPSAGNDERFASFIAQASPLVVGPMRRQWQALLPELAVLSRWFSDCDLLDRIVTIEDSYTQLIAWALNRQTHLATAELLQRKWLTSLGIDWGNAEPVEPQTWLRTEDGIPDLVLSYRTHALVVEIKTDSGEHPTPSGNPQTIAYPSAVRKALGLTSDHPIHMVFLTPDGRPGFDSMAIRSTFANFALVLAKALEEVEPPEHLRSAFAMIIRVFATYSLPFIKEAIRWQIDLTDDLLIRRYGDISLMANLLLGGDHGGIV
jgi:hypothetical protein